MSGTHRRLSTTFDDTASPSKKRFQAFFDPFLKVVDASRDGEPRDAVLGLDDGWRLLFVVHIELEDEAFRVISARRATREEWKTYED